MEGLQGGHREAKVKCDVQLVEKLVKSRKTTIELLRRFSLSSMEEMEGVKFVHFREFIFKCECSLTEEGKMFC